MQSTTSISITRKKCLRLLQDPNVPSGDKDIISVLLQKPFNPYIQRHYALSEKAKILKESVLRAHAGWGMNSKVPQVYLHYFGNESSESLLEAYGIITKDQKLTDALKPKQCPNCNEPNKPDSKFCAKCRMVLSYDAYAETVGAKESEVEKLQQKYLQDMNEMREQMKEEMKNQIGQLIIKLKPEIVREGLS
jgi:hypothetical protein